MTRVLRGLAILILITVGIWLAGSVFLGPDAARAMGDNPVVDTPGDVGLDYEDIVVNSDGVDLVGWWIPAPQPRAVMLFAHGAGSNRTSWFLPSLEFYRAATELGISVATIDLRNHGNSPKTDGKLGMGSTEWPDLLALSHWLEDREQGRLPRIGVGLSMGGATTIYALSNGLRLDGAVLIDPLLNTRDALKQGGWIAYGLPPGVFAPMAWAATELGELPGGDSDAGAVAAGLDLPLLLLQDPDDPITRLPFARQLADNNPSVQLAVSPPVASNDTCLDGKGRWGTHVALFNCHRNWTLAQLGDFFDRVLGPPQLDLNTPPLAAAPQ